ncbi:hypothetical protein C0992_009633 [Termitomyces sp. T32_za158]|nr:hypothetical protein C0992_009633 [Termitomyces sp. T32_za158]
MEKDTAEMNFSEAKKEYFRARWQENESNYLREQRRKVDVLKYMGSGDLLNLLIEREVLSENLALVQRPEAYSPLQTSNSDYTFCTNMLDDSNGISSGKYARSMDRNRDDIERLMDNRDEKGGYFRGGKGIGERSV